MADQDDFEPGGRCWKRVRDLYLAGGDWEEIAFLVEITLSRMVKVCGGSEILQPVVDALRQLSRAKGEHLLWHKLTGERPTEQFDTALARLEPFARSHRIDTVLLRTARSVAAMADVPTDPDTFATQVLLNVARHCCLDDARARSIGGRFPCDDEGRSHAHDFHNNVLKCLTEGVAFLGKRFVRDPSGRTMRRRPRPRAANLYHERLA